MRYGSGAGNRYMTGFLIASLALIVITASFPTAAAGGTRATKEEGQRLDKDRFYPPVDASQSELDAAKAYMYYLLTAPTNDANENKDWYAINVDIEQRDSDYYYGESRYYNWYGSAGGLRPTIIESMPGVRYDCDPVEFTLGGGVEGDDASLSLEVSWTFDWCGQWDIMESGIEDGGSWNGEKHYHNFEEATGSAWDDFDVIGWGSAARVPTDEKIALAFSSVIERCHDSYDAIPLYCEGVWEGPINAENKVTWEHRYYKNYGECFPDESGAIQCGDGSGEGEEGSAISCATISCPILGDPGGIALSEP